MMSVVVACFVMACHPSKDKQAETAEYTCPMHPHVVQPQPGHCPVCGMDLVKKINTDHEETTTEEVKALTRPTHESVIASVQTIHPERKAMSVTSTASGVVSYDTRKIFSVPIRFSGRIEKLFVKYNYQPIAKDQMIMEVYSPEMVAAQRELLYVASENKEDKQLIEQAKQKLILLGVTTQQIEQLVATGKESFTLPVLSPYSGYVLESTSGAVLQVASSGGMNAPENINPQQPKNPEDTAPAQLSIREGMYVTSGQSLLNVADGKNLWAELSFPAAASHYVKVGSPIALRFNNTETIISAHINFIQPFFNNGIPFLQVRAYLNDPKNIIRIGQLVTGTINYVHPQTLWVPRQSVIDLGMQQVVFVKKAGSFMPTQVKTGVRSGNMIEVADGLDESAEVALNAQYLIDSESFIKVENR